MALVLVALLLVSGCSPSEGEANPYASNLQERVMEAVGDLGFSSTVVYQTHLNRVTIKVHVRGLTVTRDAVPEIRKKAEKAVRKALPRIETEIVIELDDMPRGEGV